MEARYAFDPARYEDQLLAILSEVHALEVPSEKALERVLRRFPKDRRYVFSKSELISGLRHLERTRGLAWSGLAEKLRMKPIRTQSGVTPVTVLTKPFPCPGRCLFCPSDVRMPKSYLSLEPGAQRAAQNAFDPFAQTWSRLRAFEANGHALEKIELIILGGTWSFYPEPYQRWFIKRCFDALNQYRLGAAAAPPVGLDFSDFAPAGSYRGQYNALVGAHLKAELGALLADDEDASWEALEAAHLLNESAYCRSVGLVVETRPDRIDEAEAIRIRRLGATKVQLGVQSLDDAILAANQRDHGVAESRRAIGLLRRAGFKIHAHWMANLFGSTPDKDRADFPKLFADPAIRPDELKLYPCSLIETAELMDRHEAGLYEPYREDELLAVLTSALAEVPRYCRLTRVIRDIPSHDIVAGNKRSNFRELAEAELDRRGVKRSDIRSREIRGATFQAETLRLVETKYETAVSDEYFLEFVTAEDRIAAFVRLSLPHEAAFIEELAGAALIREVHVYGPAAGLGEHDRSKAQHLGLGRRLLEAAEQRARAAGYARLSVISAIGTRAYYRQLGFVDGSLYLHKTLDQSSALGSSAGA